MLRKILILIACCVHVGFTEAQENNCLGFKKAYPERFIFTYPTANEKRDQAYYYVIATKSHIPKKISLSSLMGLGAALSPVPSTNPQQYVLPEDSEKLYAIISKVELQNVNGSAKIEPTTENNAIKALGVDHVRMFSNRIEDLPTEIVINSKEIICEIAL